MTVHTRDVSHVEQCVACHVQVIRDHNQPGMTNGDVAALLPEHLRGPFWDQTIDGYMANELGDAPAAKES